MRIIIASDWKGTIKAKVGDRVYHDVSFASARRLTGEAHAHSYEWWSYQNPADSFNMYEYQREVSMTLTQKEYVAKSGSCCPNCDSAEVSAERLDVDGPKAVSNVQCFNCDWIWVDIWALTGYDNLEANG